MIAARALPDAIRRLIGAGVPDAARDARKLLAHAMRIAPDRLLLQMQEELTPEAMLRFLHAVDARTRRQPVAQIIGQRAFYGRMFRVTSDVLDPRPETETLIEAALAVPFTRLLDLGTGSGAILLSLLAEHPAATGLGTDLSEPALAVASENARQLGLTDRARFHASDWFANVTGTFDLIVANPPYIAQSEMASLAPEVHDWEPHLALTSGGDGLAAYRSIAAGAGAHLLGGGWLMVETGPGQGAFVAGLWRGAGLQSIAILPDLDGRDRVVIGQSSL